MLTSVVPSKHAFGHTPSTRKSKNTFEITRCVGLDLLFRGILVAVIISCIHHFEKVCRRKLLMIADNYNLFGACNNSERILWRDLAGLINNEKIEGKSSWLNKLGYRKRAHKENRLQTLDCR